MEFNREEATRAKQISEELFDTRHDVSGAMEFALKARRLYRHLEGIDELIAVLDVHLAAAEHKDSNGKKDLYRILQLDPDAHANVVKTQYRKMALMVHPDKNQSAGAEEAFKIISEACDILSDKLKREIYDQDRAKTVISDNTWQEAANNRRQTNISDNIWQEAANRRQTWPKYSRGSRILDHYFG